MKENDLFLVDDRIVPEMPRVLGKAWLQAKKSPIPVTLQRADLKGELERAISSTYLRINKGTSLSIKVGSLDAHTPEQLQENLLAIIPHLAIKLPLGGWDNVQSLHIKTTSSIALPIWNCSLGDASDESKEGRFFAAPINKEEIESKMKAKAIKEDRIQEKKARKLLGAASDDDIRALLEEGSVDAVAAAQDAALEVEGDEDEDEEAALEEIDESLVVPSSPVSEKAKKSSKKTKAKSSATASDDRKTVSSTSKKMKGLDSVKGLPRKASKKAA
jgi:ribosome biogenesis protein UTP30